MVARAAARISENVLFLHVYYEALNYEEIMEEEAFAVSSLIADCGGILGLYIGASLCSIVEVLQYVSFLFASTFSRLRCKKKERHPHLVIPTVKPYCIGL